MLAPVHPAQQVALAVMATILFLAQLPLLAAVEAADFLQTQRAHPAQVKMAVRVAEAALAKSSRREIILLGLEILHQFRLRRGQMAVLVEKTVIRLLIMQEAVVVEHQP